MKDSELFSGEKGTQTGSGVYLYLDTTNSCLEEPAEGVYKIWCSYNGDIIVWKGNCGKWDIGKKAGIRVTSDIVQGGYVLNFSIPLKNSFSKENMRISASLSTKSYIETLVHSDEKKSCTWIKMNLHP